jgi:hypothetical protein
LKVQFNVDLFDKQGIRRMMMDIDDVFLSFDYTSAYKENS